MRNVLILGAGISGLGAAHVLLKHGVSVLISDLKDTIQDKKEKEEKKKDSFAKKSQTYTYFVPLLPFSYY